MESELKKFIKDLKTIEQGMYQGLRDDAIPSGNKLVKALGRFHESVIMCREQAKLISNDISNHYNSFISSSNIDDVIANTLVMINTKGIEDSKLSSNRITMFETMAQKIVRLKGIVKTILKEHIKIHKDDEIFKPSNINKDEILTCLDNAVEALNMNEAIDVTVKNNLLTYIEETKVEVKKETPRWRKVLGDLAFVATILGGIAIAPVAFENISNAFKYIIEKPFSINIEKEYIYQLEPKKLGIQPKSTDTTV